MKIFIDPARDTWNQLCERPQLALDSLTATVKNTLTRVQTEGDAALRALTQEFDQVTLDNLAVEADELAAAGNTLSPTLREAIDTAVANIEKFHSAQKREVMTVETMPGVSCWRKGVAIDKVGIYIPGGSAPLFSTVLMLAIPARLAGCGEIILCTPPNREGKIDEAILYAAKITGVTRLFKVGGAQAIAAMAYGTESVPRVYKIFGPGNQYVTKAKQLVSEDGVAIDMPAGPSEVLILADESAEPAFIAADLLSQAEHGADSQVMLVVNSPVAIDAVQKELDRQLALLPRKAIAAQSLEHSRVVTFSQEADALEFVNEYAPEHLIINTLDADLLADKITNAGSVFLGSYTPEAAGDYASGTNHTLPTNGYAKAYAGVSLESFMKYITFQKISPDGLRTLGPVVECMAEAEALHAHKQAVSVRLERLNS